ncbi:hypothetical protein M9Y10_036668 [Tritrichomonas musculus]|uniref:Protein kinase domain-containing protein n=1 Tax=Tritrichomonas musculus TaxID=1915356 RepID=A0ABR2GTG8_9EUKA
MTEPNVIQSRYNKYIVDINDYKILDRVESGGFGSVFSVENNNTKNIYAAKIINTHRGDLQYNRMINREIGIMIKCKHPTIINIIGFSLKDFNNQSNVTIFMQLAKRGSLYDFLQKVQKGLLNCTYDNTNRQIILIGIARGMMHLHQNNVIHRDLKPGNVLLDEDLHPLITDFGLSKLNESGNSISQSQQCGTSAYMAPEIFTGSRYNGKADVYSFGILMYEIVTDSTPYPLLMSGKMTPFQFTTKVVNDDYRPQFTVPVKKSIQNLIEKCWSNDPHERPTFEQIFKRLAYNNDASFDDVYSDVQKVTEKEEEEESYYLEDVDIDAVINYADEISEVKNTAKNSDTTEVEQIVTQLKEENEGMKRQMLQFQKDKEEIEKKLMNVDEMISSIVNPLKMKLEEFVRTNDEKTKELNQLRLDYNESKNELEQMKNENAAIKKENEARKAEIEKIHKEMDKLKGAFEDRKNDSFDVVKKEQTESITSSSEKAEENVKANDKERRKSQRKERDEKSTKEDDKKSKNDEKDKKKHKEEKDKNKKKEKKFFFGKKDKHHSKDDKESSEEQPKEEKSKSEKSKSKHKSAYSIEDFNELTLKSQQSLISSILSKNSSFVNNGFNANSYLQRINKLLLYLMKYDSSSQCFQINAANESQTLTSISEEHQINLLSNSLEILIDSSFSMDELSDALKNFKYVLIDIKYASPSSQAANDVVCFLQNQNKSSKIKKAIVIDENLEKEKMFEKRDDITDVKFGPNMTVIPSGSFSSCSLLETISLSSSVQKIESYAFSECKSLKKLFLPSSVTELGFHAFGQCTSLTEINFAPNSNLSTIDANCFINCSSLVNIIFPSSVSQINDCAFYNCTSLKEVSFQSKSSIKKMCDSFRFCTSLQKFTIPDSVEKIEEGAFYGCKSLKQVAIPSSVKTIGKEAFYECELLEKVEFKNDSLLKKIEDSVFDGCVKLTQITIPLSVTEIGVKSFNGCTSLQQVTLHSNLVSILNAAFANCSALKKISIPQSITKIEPSTFFNCISLEDVTFPNSVKIIDKYAFSSCKSLRKVTLPLYLEEINIGAFSLCPIENVFISSSVKSIANNAFSDSTTICNLK